MAGLRRRADAAHVPHEGHIYKGANHGFHNDTTPRYDEAAAKEAWQHTLDWFNKYLRVRTEDVGKRPGCRDGPSGGPTALARTDRARLPSDRT